MPIAIGEGDQRVTANGEVALVAPTKETEQAADSCPNCGAAISESRYCEMCGHRLQPTAAATKPANEPEEESAKKPASKSSMHLTDAEILMYAGKQTDRFVVIDTETTGLNPEKDEVLSLAIVDQDGNNLFYHYIKPETRKRWPKATEVHGITWKDVKDEQELWKYRDELDAIFAQYDYIVGYNLEFDRSMLEASGYKVKIDRDFDLMHAYADAYGRWNERRGDYTWVKLTQCAKHYKYKFEAHDALNDARATAHCYRAFVADCCAAKDAKGDGYWLEYENQRNRQAEKARQETAAREAARERSDKVG